MSFSRNGDESSFSKTTADRFESSRVESRPVLDDRSLVWARGNGEGAAGGTLRGRKTAAAL